MAITNGSYFSFYGEVSPPVHLAAGNHSKVILPYNLDSSKLNFDSDENIATSVRHHLSSDNTNRSSMRIDGIIGSDYNAEMLDVNRYMIDSMDNTKLDDENFKVGTISYFKPVTSSEVANYIYKDESGEDAIFRKIRLSNSSTSDHYDAKFSKLLTSFTTNYQIYNHFSKIINDEQNFSTVTAGFSFKICESTKDFIVFDSFESYAKSFTDLVFSDQLLMPKYSNLDFSEVADSVSLDDSGVTTAEQNRADFASSMLMSPLVGKIIDVAGYAYIGDDAIRKIVILKWIRDFVQKYSGDSTNHLVIIPFSGDDSKQLSFKHINLKDAELSLPKIFEDEKKVPPFLNDIFKDDTIIRKVICVVVKRNQTSENKVTNDVSVKLAEYFEKVLRFSKESKSDDVKSKLLRHMFISKWQ